MQQLMVQVISHDNQYQWGHPLFQLGMTATVPMRFAQDEEPEQVRRHRALREAGCWQTIVLRPGKALGY